MEPLQRKRYCRLIYAKALNYFACALVVSALIAGAYGERLYFMFALCAAGCVFLAWSWFTQLRAEGFHLPGFGTQRSKRRVPYIHQRKKAKPHRPSFAMDNTDFDDDLVSATACNEEEFEPKQRTKAHILARAACGFLLLLTSLLINL